MFSFLKDHPFAVEAFFESSLVLAFAVPKDEAAQLIPECLTVDSLDDKWGFVAVAMVQTKGLRPKGFPAIFGSDFFLIGYRVFVRFTDSQGKRSRGLYILGSATNRRRMEFVGNIFTHYDYETIDIARYEREETVQISSKAAGLNVTYEMPDAEEVPLPDTSPFSSWKEARRFAGPLPFTFTYETGDESVLIIEGVRQNWMPRPVKILDHAVAFIDRLGLTDVRLANAFLVQDVPYLWKKGRRERWTAE
jgi:Uncharacterized conserved protein (COG2071)